MQNVFNSISATTNYTSSSYEAFACMAKDGAGTYHLIYRRGTSHVADAGAIVERMASTIAGLASAGETVLFADSSTSCGGGVCDFRNAACGTAPDGSVALMWTRYNQVGAATLDVRFARYANASWSGATVFSGTAVDGNTTWSGTYAQVSVMPGGNIGTVLMDAAATKGYLVESIDNGTTWSIIRRIQDSGGAALAVPTNETVCTNSSGNKILCFSRGCDGNGASCSLKSFYSADAGVTWTSGTLANTVSTDCNVKDGAVVNWNHVSPWVFGTTGGNVTLVWAERISTPSSGYCSNLRALTFDPSTVTSAPTSFSNIDQRIWQESIGSPGFPDWGYPACVATGGLGVACAWYSTTAFGGSIANLRSLTATLGPLNTTISGTTMAGFTFS